MAGEMNHAKRVNYSALIDKKLRRDIVALNFFNQNYEGDAKAEAVKIPVRSVEAIVSDYNGFAGSAMHNSSTDYITLYLDQEKYVNEYINGFDAVSVPDGIVAERIDSAGYALAETIDTFLFDKLATEGTTAADTAASTKSNIYSKILDGRTALREAGVPVKGTALAVSPAVMALILKSDEFIKSGDLSQGIVAEGAVGMIAGFPVYESNNLPTGVEFMLVNKTWATYATAWKIPVGIFSLNGDNAYVGDSAIKGRIVYGAKVTNAAAVYVKKTA